MKIKLIIFAFILLGLTAAAENSSAKSTKKSNWKSFTLPHKNSSQSEMLVGWNGSRLVVKLKPQPGEGGYSLAKEKRKVSLIEIYNVLNGFKASSPSL